MLVLASIVLAPDCVFAQQSGSVPRIGLLWIDSASSTHYISAFREGLRALGHVEGKSISIDDRSLVNGYDALAAAADRLAREKVSVIVTFGSTAVQAAHKAAPGIPIVMATSFDPVKLGVVASLARPGGNVTGMASINEELSGKRLELLKEIVPRVRRVAVLFSPGSSAEVSSLGNIETAARALNLETRPVGVRGADDIDSAIASIARMEVQAVALVANTLFTAHRKQIAAALGKARMPAIYVNSEFVESGGLVAYGPNYADQFRRAAIYVDKILKGAKPADLPIEQPTKFELAVNMKTAKALGLTIPQAFLMRADRVIE